MGVKGRRVGEAKFVITYHSDWDLVDITNTDVCYRPSYLLSPLSFDVWTRWPIIVTY